MRQRFALGILTLALSACGGSAPSQPAPKQVVKTIPDWFTQVPRDPNMVFAASSAESRDLQLAVNKATQDGRFNLAQQLEVKYSGLSKRFQEETGTGADATLLDQFQQTYKGVVSQTLNGSRVSKQEVVPTGQTYRAYVLVEMPIGAANQVLVQKMKANEQMYTRYRATEAFKELEAEVAKYEEWKKSNPQ
ncbi:MAG: LPP20 family lipoprotein [Gemmatimonadales bacterium]|nr:LPP20 family lipoprotein [Gemmatimonadales bacterium]